MVKTKLITVNTSSFSFTKRLDEKINEFLSSNDKYDRLIDIKYSATHNLTNGTSYTEGEY